jgi:hypothetical protein
MKMRTFKNTLSMGNAGNSIDKRVLFAHIGLA